MLFLTYSHPHYSTTHYITTGPALHNAVYAVQLKRKLLCKSALNSYLCKCTQQRASAFDAIANRSSSVHLLLLLLLLLKSVEATQYTWFCCSRMTRGYEGNASIRREIRTTSQCNGNKTEVINYRGQDAALFHSSEHIKEIRLSPATYSLLYCWQLMMLLMLLSCKIFT